MPLKETLAATLGDRSQDLARRINVMVGQVIFVL